MSEEKELQARIAAIAGRINLHKQHGQTHHTDQQFPHHGLGRGSANWVAQPGTPYGSPRGRGGTFVPPAHKNRTLVINPAGANSAAQIAEPGTAGTAAPPSAALSSAGTPGWVSKRDRHMQLIKTSIYDQQQQERIQAMQATMKQKQRERNDREKAKIARHFSEIAKPRFNPDQRTSYATPALHEIVVDNVRFHVANGGSKLIRVSNDPNPARATPKQAKVGGVAFFRSKNGNLYRSGLVKAKKVTVTKKIPEPCPRFTSTGTCPRGPVCRYVHDPHKVAICKDFLQSGTCQAGDNCDLSHDPTPERVPACLHFLRGKCTNPDCRYAHVRVNPGAPVCRAFATLGYCQKGADCTERHVNECPDYANTGICRKSKCRLPHVDRAGTLRKAAAAKANSSPEAESSDISSDEEDHEEIDSDDVDSDGLDEDSFMQGVDDSHELSQQQDFIRF
ncbi:CCCH zinc finger protein [Cryomyces antarcticus]